MSDGPVSGEWIGTVSGVMIREPGPDAGGPVVQVHGTEGVAAFEVTDPEIAGSFAEMSAELRMAIDRARELDADPASDPYADADRER